MRSASWRLRQEVGGLDGGQPDTGTEAEAGVRALDGGQPDTGTEAEAEGQGAGWWSAGHRDGGYEGQPRGGLRGAAVTSSDASPWQCLACTHRTEGRQSTEITHEKD